ncbi:PREDICTED: membrane-bound transcription factor site-2 protease homolog isoform X1 [Brassica oleracea var. oleracea]|uniref:Endopeptidase S2P n=1 Tax=Brassica oleracea var. oleracea TaxID=109376 RepID=A0A0D3A4L1_BRAOL|nr:PREDICTED: membrane-bound transcription factor site-2 protease homolog isoform X1 [Brassica oleracea var. oleracea]
MEISGRRMRRFRMRFGRNRLAGGENDDGSVLSTRNGGNTENEASCCYCDLKITMFNEHISRLGRRFSGAMKIWFSIGLGFGVASLLLVTLFLLLQFHPKPLSNRLASAVFGFSPSTRVSLSGFVYVFVSTVITVLVHELGHALAAASEGIQMEYIAVFIAAIFPGGLVAFDHDLLQSLPSFNALRVYCAGVWHNAVFCALCAFGLFLLPVMLSPFYKHGESLVVVDVPSKSPLFGYLSPGDTVVSLDGIRVYKPSEWLELAAILDKQNTETSNASFGGSRRFHHGKGYCVPISMVEEGFKGKMVENRYVCPGDLTPFSTMPCSDVAAPREVSVCLDAKDIVKLNKCGDGWVTTSETHDNSGCVCPQGEMCLQAMQSPGISWTEISYKRTSSLDCSRLGMDFNTSSCVGTFVFVGDLIAMSRSVQLTAYQPRWLLNYFVKSFPDIVERSLTCTFHVSLALVLLNSLPVYYLDGESILESCLQFFTWLSPRKKKKALQLCLFGGSLLSLLAFFRIFFVGLPPSR